MPATTRPQWKEDRERIQPRAISSLQRRLKPHSMQYNNVKECDISLGQTIKWGVELLNTLTLRSTNAYELTEMC